jgi:hypothetical protein
MLDQPSSDELQAVSMESLAQYSTSSIPGSTAIAAEGFDPQCNHTVQTKPATIPSGCRCHIEWRPFRQSGAFNTRQGGSVVTSIPPPLLVFSSPPSHLRTTMIIVLAILAATRASPLGLQSPPLVTLGQLQPPSCDDPNGCRSLWDIIRSCALTLFLCTWVSIHPNVPSPDDRWPRIALRRFGLMLAVLTVPEAIIAWALRQRLASIELASQYKGES